MSRSSLALIGRWVWALMAALYSAGCSPPSVRFWATFDQEAVAADQETASRAGAAMLARGGNAVDAAVATSFALSVVRPHSCGIGGGGFMVIHVSERGIRAARRAGRVISGPQDVALDYRETAPAFATPDYYEKINDPDASTRGGRAIAIPGTVAGLLHALEMYGTLPREVVLAPAIRAAENGFTVDEHYVRAAHDVAKKIRAHEGWSRRFSALWSGFLLGDEVKVGDVIRNPEQAGALRLIARDGASAFYSGPIAERIIEAVQADRGELTREDLAGYRIVAGEPLRFAFRGRTLLTMPPPSSGGVAMGQALHILDLIAPEPPRPVQVGSNVAQVRQVVSFANRESGRVRAYRFGPVYNHALAESFQHAFADRSRWLGDPAFVSVPTDLLLSEDYAKARAATFSFGHTLAPEAYGTKELPDDRAPAPDHGTSHFSVVDRWGSAVACSETINLNFGSWIVVPRFGFLLNNQMDDFTTRRGKPNEFGLVQSDRNAPAPGKRPLSSMTPTIVLDGNGRVEAVVGASGGPRIITGTMQALLNAFVFGDPAKEAVSRPRIHHQWLPDVLELEGGLFDGPDSAHGPWAPGGPSTLRDALGRLGHDVRRAKDESAVQMILRDEAGAWGAACDPRRGGRPAGQ